MTKITHLNSIYMNYLTPLQTWRIMDLESLRRECDTEPNYNNFARIIRKMEKENIVESFNPVSYTHLTLPTINWV